jgi:malonyl-CoA/methylmalonyl-CoA synthetase
MQFAPTLNQFIIFYFLLVPKKACGSNLISSQKICISTLYAKPSMIQFLRKVNKFHNKTAIIEANQSYEYIQLILTSYDLACMLLEKKSDLAEQRVAFMVKPGAYYVATQWGIWRAGGVAVPLCVSHPLPSLQYVIEDAAVSIIVVEDEFFSTLAPLAKAKNIRIVNLKDYDSEGFYFNIMPQLPISRRAMMLYTSGTTSKPKGVVTTHGNLNAQINTLIKEWEWTPEDHILCFLPLHHIHGVINVVSCALWAGAVLEFLEDFSAKKCFDAILAGKVNVFMAVPTIYFKLIAYYETLPLAEQEIISERLKTFRLMVSGSAALPISVMEKWQQISGHTLLERYGMTEIGMGIGNPYLGERKAGYIGKALHGVKARLVDESNKKVKAEQPGEIQIKGANVFLEYWQKPEATQQAFTADGWFKTGDVAVKENDYYRILGRESVDIIKSGGYKISALEIEEVLRGHAAISDCSVVGIADEEWGEMVVAALVLSEKDIDLKALNLWIRELMPAYRVPRRYLIVSDFPRNAMGKVVKNELKELFKTQ